MPTILAGGIDVTDAEMAALENDLLDVDQWVRDALRGKINNCTKRLAASEAERLKRDPAVTSMPADNEALVQSALSRPGYRKRKDRSSERR